MSKGWFRAPSRMARRWLLVPVAVAMAVSGVLVALPGASTAAATTVSVSVVGNALVNGAGQPIRLLGVDRSGTEYACIQDWGIFDGPSNATSVAAIAAWHVNAVRVPLNEDCWLGLNGVNPAYGGANYQSAIESYVRLLNAAGLVAILDLHWNAPGSTPADGQQVMADADHSPAFWTSVATAFRSNPGVVFDLYNEPHTISWSCWLHGCTTSAGWQAAGMQTLVDAIRATGATQPLMVAGLNWAGDLSQWLAYEPVDPLRQLVASVHLYNFSECNTEACWNQTIAPVAAKVPVVTGELGETDCSNSFIDGYMAWADTVGVSYLGWTWDAGGGWTCSNGPSLITDYQGDPTVFGAGLQAHLASLGGGGTTATTTTTAPPTTTTTTTAPATGKVTVTYTVTNQWSGGLQANLAIANGSSVALGAATSPWTLSFTVPTSAATITSLWNGTVRSTSSDGTTTYTVTGPTWQATIPAGTTWDVGYTANGSGAVPANCLLDGVACTVGTGSGPPTTTTTAPPSTTTTTTRPRPLRTTTRPPATTTTTTAPHPTTTTTTVPATGKVTVTYTVTNQWSGGLQANLAIANGSSAALGTPTSPWTLSFTLPASAATVTSLWDGTLRSTTAGGTTTYTVTGPSWQPTIPAGTTWDVGYTANGSGATPSGGKLDGVACTIG